MNIIVLTNDNYFSFKVLRTFLEMRKKDIKLIVFSSALIGERDLYHSISWLLRHTGVRHTAFKLLVYGVFKIVGGICKVLPFIQNRYSTALWARQNQIPTITTPKINKPDIVEKVRLMNPDLIVSVSMNQIVKKDILHMPKKGCINVHCGPLPRYGGMSPYVWVLAHNYDHSAATIHYMEEGLDEGDILAQQIEKVVRRDSAFSLFYRCCSLAEPLLIKVVDDIESVKATSYPQDLSNKTYFSWPSRDCIASLHKNGYYLAKFSDFTKAVFGGTPQKSLNGQPMFLSRSKHSVFVTYGWCRTTYAAALSLGRRGIDVHVSDASSVAMSRYSRYCKSYTKVPDFFVEPDKYFETTCEALRKTEARVLLPCHEDVGIFCRRKNELPEGVRTSLPEWDSYRVAEDKLAILDVAAQAGCPTPMATKVESLNHLEKLSRELEWPIVLKTHIGNSAKGVRIAHNRAELITKYKELVETFRLPQERWPFLQEFLPGDAAGVCMLYQNGRCVTSFAEQYIRCKEPGKFGTSTLREPFDNPQLVARAKAVMDKLKWNGVAHIDFVKCKKGEFRLIEVNPRLWGALALSVFAGVDFPYLWYLTAMGESIDGLHESKYPPIKCRWIVGDCLAFIEHLKCGRFSEAAKILTPQRNCFHDDFVLSDPLPFSFELMDYVAKFLRSGGSVNPVTGGMVR